MDNDFDSMSIEPGDSIVDPNEMNDGKFSTHGEAVPEGTRKKVPPEFIRRHFENNSSDMNEEHIFTTEHKRGTRNDSSSNGPFPGQSQSQTFRTTCQENIPGVEFSGLNISEGRRHNTEWAALAQYVGGICSQLTLNVADKYIASSGVLRNVDGTCDNVQERMPELSRVKKSKTSQCRLARSCQMKMTKYFCRNRNNRRHP